MRLLAGIVERAPDFAEALFNLAVLRQRVGETEEAAGYLRRASELEPGNPRPSLALGIALAELDDMPGAVSALRKAVELQPRNPDTHYNLGLALTKNQSLEEAIGSFRTALDLHPVHPGARRALGAALQQTGDLSAAARELERAVRDFPDDSDARNTLGATLLRLKDVDGAIRHLEEATRRSPLLVKAHRNLAQGYQRAGRKADAIAATERSVAAASKRASASRAILLVETGKQLLANGDPSAAVDAFREATEISPDSEDAHLFYGLALWEASADTQGALLSLDRAIQINPQRAVAHYRRGLVLHAAGREGEALDAFRSCVNLAPSLVEAQRALGSLAFKAGELAAASAALNAVLAWNPDDSAARDRLAQIRRQSNQ